MPLRDTSDKVIIQDGWSDLVARYFEEFRLADAGISLATRSEPDEATRETSLGRGLVILTVNIERVSLQKEAPKDLLAVCCCQRGFGAALYNNSLLAQNNQVRFHIIAFKTRWMFAVVQENFVVAFSSDSLPAQNRQVFASGCFGVVFCQPAVRPALS